jgi:hypothetical protein
MKYLKEYKDIQWDWDFEEDENEENNTDFEYVSVKNGSLKLFNDTWTNGWNVKNFVPLTKDDLLFIKQENKRISFYNDGRSNWVIETSLKSTI